MRLKWYRTGWYAVQSTPTGTRRVSLRTRDREIAAQRLADLSTAVTKPAKARITTDDILTGYQQDKAERGQPVERIGYSGEHIRPFFGHLRPEQIGRAASRLYVKQRRAHGASDGTIRREMGTLKAALRWHDPQTPATIEMPSAPPPKDRYLTRDEYQRLLEAAVSHHVRLFIVLALATAGRAQAVLDLTWDRVDFRRGQILLADHEQRGRKGRATVPMTKSARDALEIAREVATIDHVIEYAGARVASVKKAFERTAKRAGLEGVTPHVLRHTAAVWMAEAGRPIDEIAQYLGHSSPAITYRVYARYSPDYLSGAASALEI